MRILTLGVYERTETEFFDLIANSKIALFVDVRRIRGLRGGKYKFANSNYLQAKLATLGIAYYHALALSPSAEIRAVQHSADKAQKTLKRDRDLLTPEFVKAYTNEVLQPENLDQVMKDIRSLTKDKKNPTIGLFCVERNHEACHRSLLAKTLAKRYNLSIDHI